MANNENMNSDEEEVILLLDDEVLADLETTDTEEEVDETETKEDEEIEVPSIPVVPSRRKVFNKKEELEYEYDEDDDDDEEDDDDDDDGGFLTGMGGKLLIVFGIAIAVLAIFVGVKFMNRNTAPANVVDFSQTGANIAAMGSIGGDNIGEVIGAYGERIGDLLEVRKNYDYDEVDEETGKIPVDVTLTTILKDLKIKFVNSKNKLIANVPFKVEVTKPDGSKETLTDDDKDGVIYLSEIDGGAYKVSVLDLDGYNDYYDFTVCDTKSATVKTQIEYKKVDVSNEIKVADETTSKKEDTKVAETEQESKLTDTVAYVPSEKKQNSDGYVEIAKSTIADPLTKLQTSYFSRFRKLAAPGTHEHDYGTPVQNAGTNTHTATCRQSDGIACSDLTVTDSCEDANSDGFCDGCGGPMPAAPTSCSGSLKYTYNEDKTHSGVCDVNGSSCTDHPQVVNQPCTDNGSGICSVCKANICDHTIKAYKSLSATTHGIYCQTCKTEVKSSETCDWDGDGKCKNAASGCTNTKPAASIEASGSIALDKSSYGFSATDTSNNVLTATASIAFTAGESEVDTSTYTYTWTSSDASIVKLTENNKAAVKCEILKAGTATLKCEIAYGVKSGSTASAGKVVATKEVKIDGSAITLSAEKVTVYAGGDAVTVTATATGGAKNTVTASVADADKAYAEVTVTDGKTITIKGSAAGKFNITVVSADDTNVKKTIEVTVYMHPKTDTATKLTDVNGKQVYVKKNGSFVEAKYADYYTETTFYTSGTPTYKYTGWWTMDGKTYYFDANGKKVTGDQVILGAKYSFGSDGVLKSGTGSFGIDVSTWNGTIDWSKVAKSGVSYAIIRCGFRGSSEGGLYEDNKFANNIKNATAAGVKIGVYFFTQAVTEAEAIEEASMCIGLVENYKLTYPIFIDVESSGGRADGLSKDARTKIIKAFCETIKNAGYTPGVYANKNWLTTKINATELTAYKIWLAQYASQATYTTTRYDMWQYSSKGNIDGISGNVDLNLSYLGY